MEKEKQKKPRTIQMKYPAQYSQSWNDTDKKAPTTSKKSKPKKSSQSNAGAASHSWANERSERADERACKRAKRKAHTARAGTQIIYPLPFTKFGVQSDRKVTRARKVICTQRRPTAKHPSEQCTCCGRRRPDPTVPHLKYGLFPPKKTATKSQAQVVAGTGVKSRSSTAGSGEKKEKNDKDVKAPGNVSPPLLVLRTLDSGASRQLSVSPPSHLDIRPRPRVL